MRGLPLFCVCSFSGLVAMITYIRLQNVYPSCSVENHPSCSVENHELVPVLLLLMSMILAKYIKKLCGTNVFSLFSNVDSWNIHAVL
jgi:Na+/H+ antiporter NhaC